MASLTSANVRTIKEWVEGDLCTKRRMVKRIEMFSIAAGGTSNTIPATAFGMKVIEEVSIPYNANTTRAVAATPNADGSLVYLFAAVDNNTAPADVTASASPVGLYFTVKGY